MTTENIPLRMRVIHDVLEGATDARDETVIAACHHDS
jgi:hypothetical protein